MGEQVTTCIIRQNIYANIVFVIANVIVNINKTFLVLFYKHSLITKNSNRTSTSNDSIL